MRIHHLEMLDVTAKWSRWLVGICMPIIFLDSCHDKGQETGPIISVNMLHIHWACDCADWIPVDLFDKYEYDGDSLAAHCVFIEPASEEFMLPENLDSFGHMVRFTGRYYEHAGFPEGYSSPEDVDEAMVFRYTSYELVQ